MQRQGADPYQVLGLDNDASQEEIRKAFRRLAFSCHPDRNPADPGAEERFKRITDAFEALANPAARAAFDRQIPKKSNGPASQPDPFDMLARQFCQVFGSPEPQDSLDPDPDDEEVILLQAGFMEAALGAVRCVNVECVQHCDPCRGRGAVAQAGASPCRRCNGRGVVMADACSLRMDVRCPLCRGLGLVPWRKCPDCQGAGGTLLREAAEVRIPAGSDTGGLLRFVTPSGRKVAAVLEVEPHEFFRRRGRDLLVRVKASMQTALRGGMLTVPGLEGELRVKVPAGLRPGQQVRIKGRGLPSCNGEGRGDLVAEIEVSGPSHRGMRNLLAGLGHPGSSSGGQDPADS